MSRDSSARRRRSAAGTPANFRESSTFWAAVRLFTRLKFWKTMPIPWRARRSSSVESAVRSTPSTRTWPELGRSRRLMFRSRVDLPAPEKPMMPWMLPGAMSRLASSTAVNGPAGVEKAVVT